MMVNIECVIKACEGLGIEYKVLDEHSNFIEICSTPAHYFIQTKTPLSTSDFVEICKDKDYTYKLLKDFVRMPKTKSYLDPYIAPEYDEYRGFASYDQILTDIQKEFSLPLIIKKNKGSVGRNVFLCKTVTELNDAVRVVLDHNSKHYDYVVLAQEKLDIAQEYRVVVYKNKVEFAYLKDNSKAKFTGNLSPLHWEGAKASLVNDDLHIKFQEIVSAIAERLDLKWAGLDLVYDVNGDWYLVEINSHPSFSKYVEDNGDQRVVELYRKVLMDII